MMQDRRDKVTGMWNTRAPDLEERSDIIDLLIRYSEFLVKQGYMDTDWRAEKPYAIDEFMKTYK